MDPDKKSIKKELDIAHIEASEIRNNIPDVLQHLSQ